MSRNHLAAVAALALWISAGVLSLFVYPDLRQATLTASGQPPQQANWPFFTWDSSEGTATWKIELDLSRLHPSVFSIFGDGALQSVKVNGANVTSAALPVSLDPRTAARINLRGYLRPGKNELIFDLEKKSGYRVFSLYTSPLDPLNLGLLALLIAASAATLYYLHLRRPKIFPLPILAILLLGIALRFFYVSGTPFDVRAHDVDGHITFIEYVADHLSLPPANHSWETHQPPLYYLLCGGLGRLTGLEGALAYGQWQQVALVLSVASLLICVPIGSILFRNRPAVLQIAFLLVVAVFPGLVYVSARINNDTLYSFLSFLWFLLLLWAWEKPTLRNWIPVFALLGVGMLVKNGTLVLAGITGLCLLLHPEIPWRRKFTFVAVFGGVFLLIAGVYQVPKYLHSQDMLTYLVATKYKVPQILEVPKSLWNMLTFDPAKVVAIPFNDPWTDECRRMYFLEYLFKSSFFGEWRWRDGLLLPARVVVVFGLAGVVLAGAGLWQVLRSGDRFRWPILITGFALIASQGIMIWQRPLACSQDFRFHVLMLVPLCYLAASGAEAFPKIGFAVLGLFALSAAVFQILLVAL